MTSLLQAYTMLEQVEEAIRAFEEMDRDPHAVDSTALSVYINALARAGRMEAALRVLQRSDEAARQAGARGFRVSRVEPVAGQIPNTLVRCGGASWPAHLREWPTNLNTTNLLPPPLQLIDILIGCVVFTGEQPSVQAYGAIVAGFARQRDANAALDIFKHFIAAGGAPDKMMFDTLLSLCIKCEEYKSARQVCGPSARAITLSSHPAAHGGPAKSVTVGSPFRNGLGHHRTDDVHILSQPDMIAHKDCIASVCQITGST
jgi:pentatricopeptide repeat protein